MFVIDSIKKNKSLYIPYFMISALFVMMFYIISALGTAENIKMIDGGRNSFFVLNLGSNIILFFSLILLFYTNSFLTKRRDAEYVLYNILGMSRRNIAHILFWDTIITYALSVLFGLISGIVFYKLAEVGLVTIMNKKIDYSLTISVKSIIKTIICYGVIYALIMIKNMIKVKIKNPSELLRSSTMGDKPPKKSWILGIMGILLLGVGYYIALTTENPLAAYNKFFIAVLFVISGTFLLFTALSILILRLTQKKKSYHYRTNNFISTSSMVYRMKRNGVGLAAICILATMALVTISFSSSLYVGSKDVLNIRYPRDIGVSYVSRDENIDQSVQTNSIKKIVDKVADEMGVKIYDVYSTYYMKTVGRLEENNNFTLINLYNESDIENVFIIKIISTEQYRKESGQNINLKSDQAMVYATGGYIPSDEIRLNGKKSLKVVNRLKEDWDKNRKEISSFDTVFIVVNSPNQLAKEIYSEKNETHKLDDRGIYNFNVRGKKGVSKEELETRLRNEIIIELANSNEFIRTDVIAKTKGISGYYYAVGGMFFIGLILSALFVSAAVLIIYYKQIVEGYEDQKRFGIMKKIGLTEGEIRKSINSQLLFVFISPLIVAGIHLIVAFPMLRNMLIFFELYNTNIFIIATLISYITFGIFYGIVYKLTSKVYFNIVNTSMR